MTRLDALKELAAKVEAGKIESAPFWKVWMPEDANGGFAYTAKRAANGSLDAAKALHDAVPTPNAIMSDADAKIILFGRNGARHWLAWKLSALIAQEAE